VSQTLKQQKGALEHGRTEKDGAATRFDIPDNFLLHLVKLKKYVFPFLDESNFAFHGFCAALQFFFS